MIDGRAEIDVLIPTRNRPVEFATTLVRALRRRGHRGRAAAPVGAENRVTASDLLFHK